MKRQLTILSTLLLCWFSCKTRTDEPSRRSKIRSAVVDSKDTCALACINTTNDNDWAVCYSCKCKEAFDNYMPKAEDLQCAKGEELKIFKLVGEGDKKRLEQVTTDVEECFNPDRLRNHCSPGSRLTQHVKGDLVFKVICKRESFISDFNDLDQVFNETGIIGYNMRNGAACFWDDNDNVVNGTNNPEIDLTDGDSTKVAKFLSTYYRHEGDECIGCHDNDPFNYNTHFATSKWYTNRRITKGPYWLVKTNGTKTSVGKHLVSEKAAECTSCHRISQGATCSSWALDSMGYSNANHLQAAASAESSEWGVITDASGFKWSYPYWMPDYNYMSKNLPLPLSKREWTEGFGEALTEIRHCCANPAASGCVWRDTPIE